MQGIVKRKEEDEVESTSNVGSAEVHIKLTEACLDPASGIHRLIAYIVGDLTEDEHLDFADHVSRCNYCLKEIVLWRMAQVVVEGENPPGNEADSILIVEERTPSFICEQKNKLV